ncbi:GNAT family N-acetyltransferase [Actinophytocola sediminis]
MWSEAAKRLAKRGLDQWQYPVKVHNVQAAVDAGTCWLATDSFGGIIGTITVDRNAEAGLWYPEDKPQDSLYLHRMVTKPRIAGQELGSALMDWAGRRAMADKLSWIRLDAWRNNQGLWNYYLDRGFELVRVVADPTGSGACFQRPAHMQLCRGPKVVELSQP